jgi:hypothetical protein
MLASRQPLDKSRLYRVLNSQLTIDQFDTAINRHLCGLISISPQLQLVRLNSSFARWITQNDHAYTCHADNGHWALAIDAMSSTNAVASTIVNLAYHLTKSPTDKTIDRVQLLRQYGAGDIVIRCPVIDAATTQLLV